MRDALNSLIRYIRLHTEALNLRMEEHGGTAIFCVEIKVRRPVPIRQSMELTVGVLYRVLRSLVGPHWRPLVCFAHAAPRRRDTHRRMLAGRVEFGHDFNGVVCKAASRDVFNGEVPGRRRPIPATGRVGSTNWGVQHEQHPEPASHCAARARRHRGPGAARVGPSRLVVGRGGAEHAHGHHCLGLDGTAALNVKAADGVVWLIDLGNPNQTERSGFTAASAKPGDAVVVLGNRDKDKSKMHIKAVRITVAGSSTTCTPSGSARTEALAPVQLLEWIDAWPGAVLLRGSGTAWLLVDAAHILGVGLLVGAIVPLDLRLLGLFRALPLALIAPFLSRAAAAGAALVFATGLWLFSMKPAEYFANGAFLWKAALLALALANVALQHANRGYAEALAGGAVRLTVRLAALGSILLWLSVLVAGRWIGFV